MIFFCRDASLSSYARTIFRFPAAEKVLPVTGLRSNAEFFFNLLKRFALRFRKFKVDDRKTCDTDHSI